MKIAACTALAACLAVPSVLAQNAPEALRGKVKPGMYSYKMEMDMGQIPGAPPGMGKQTMNMQHCLTAEDIGKGEMGRGRQDGKPRNCEMKDFRMSGNTATYKMVCTGEMAMVADNTITFVADGYNMKMAMQMDRGGQKMNMTQNMEARYLGACQK